MQPLTRPELLPADNEQRLPGSGSTIAPATTASVWQRALIQTERIASDGPTTQSRFTFDIRGVVQGVGFRPTVRRIATSLGLPGSVRNNGGNVEIELFASAAQCRRFLHRLQRDLPPLASVETIKPARSPVANPPGHFQISPSRHGSVDGNICADTAICASCRHELADPDDRRFRHAFINCVHCGPRYSISTALPWDRHHTGMATFEMCSSCRSEYHSEPDRRYHAQPLACPRCGPTLRLVDRDNADWPDPLTRACDLLANGAILAIKGVGGYQLCCDATLQTAVSALRLGKHRPGKPLALIARDLDMIRRYCAPDATEQAALCSPAAPIVLLDKLPDCDLPDDIAPGMQQLGFMLASNPLHLLLFDTLDVPLVLTSGNTSGDPQIGDDTVALEKLSAIADGFLMHDRPIINRVDDSVVRRIGRRIVPLRHARGLAPGSLLLPDGFDHGHHIVALGAQMKSAIAMVHHDTVRLSEHIGDLDNADTLERYEQVLSHYLRYFSIRPEAVATDLHPDFPGTPSAAAMIEQPCRSYSVQHHHAHIAACLLDNRVAADSEPVFGLALDGTGLGTDETVWGGELLLTDYRDFRRIGALDTAGLAGGDLAIRQPWRSLVCRLAQDHRAGCIERARRLPQLAFLDQLPVEHILAMQQQSFNTPLTSSAGRLFDAVACLLGLCPPTIEFDGQPALLLEQQAVQADSADDTRYPVNIDQSVTPWRIDSKSLWPALLDDLESGTPARQIARRFHRWVADACASLLCRASEHHGRRPVVLSGGCFQNALLTSLLVGQLHQHEFEILQHRRIPPNDGGLAAGQAVVALARLQRGD